VKFKFHAIMGNANPVNDSIFSRGGGEDTTFEAKAKDSEKVRGQ